MNAPNESQLKEVILHVLSGIAPEIDVQSLDAARDLRDQIDIDSVDFLNFVIGLHKELGIEIPDADTGKLTTLKGCIDYLLAGMEKSQGGR
jgi:acyl carrier protein